MAITLNGTQNALPADRLPSGYTLPTVTTVPDFHWRYDVVIPITVAGTVASTASASMTAIVSATNTAVSAILTADYLSSATVVAYAVINDIGSNFTPTNNNTSMSYLLSATTNQYLVSTTIFVKAT
jgi:hypothetical protein